MRRVSILVSILAVAAVSALGGLASAARQGTPAATPDALPAPLAEWEAALNAHDIDRLLTLYAADAVWEEPAIGLATRGHDGIRAHLEAVFAAVPDIAFSVTGGFLAGNRAATEWTVSGTYTADFQGLPPATGQSFSFRGASIYELADGTIVRYTEYWDALTFLTQLGALPAPGGAGTPVAAGTPDA